MKTTPIVGQTLYSLNVGNAARHRKQELTPVVVESIGRKYFTVFRADRSHLKTQYHLSDWREKTEYCIDSKLYTSEQEWKDEVEMSAICHKLWRNFEYGHNPRNLSLDDLRQINSILTKYDEP